MQGRFKREGNATGESERGGTTGRHSSSGRAHGDDTTQAAVTADEPDARDTARGDAGDAAAHRKAPTGGGSRLALGNWRISTRLISLIALPVVAATALGAVRIQDSMESIEQLDNMQLLTNMTQQATRLAAALQEERDRSAGPLVSGRSAKSEDVTTPRERTDSSRQAFAEATLAIDGNDEAMVGINARVLDIGRQLNQIKIIRDEAYEDEDYVSQTVMRYSELIDSLLSLAQDLAQATSNSEMIRSTRALAAFSTAKEQASIQRAIISGGFARAEVDGQEAGLSRSDWRYGSTALDNEKAAMRSFAQLYGDKERTDDLIEPLEGGIVNVVAANQLAESVFSKEDAITGQFRSYRDWYDLSRTKIEAMDIIEQTLLEEMEEQARQLRDEAQRDAILNGALIILVLGLSLVGAFVVARSMVRSLRRLQDTAQDVAHRRLPEVVRQMSETDPQDVDTTVESVGVHTRDEIGRVAQAFDEVHQQAVLLAGEQAQLRGNVNAMFTNLSRRSQGLIQRQLSLISELESREADPDQLSVLFKLDHLATRMRRNGENLLVLAGEEPGRRWTRPVPLVDVLRAAASEVEQYERIELAAVPKTEVVGRSVNDLVHLLAELLENATSFSSPQTKVKVTGHQLPDGRVLVEIHDTGIGLSPEDLGEINERLANPPTVDVSVSRRMGLFVVGRLSLRHGIRIQLRPSDSGGTTALVMLPAEVAQGGVRKPNGPAGARTDAAGQPPSATLRREPADRRGPGDQGPPVEPGPSRGQVPGAARPALPSRPMGPGGPAAPPDQGQGFPRTPVPNGVGAGEHRPSWASGGNDRIPADARARGHEDPNGGDTREFPAVAPSGAPAGQAFQQYPQQAQSRGEEASRQDVFARGQQAPVGDHTRVDDRGGQPRDDWAAGYAGGSDAPAPEQRQGERPAAPGVPGGGWTLAPGNGPGNPGAPAADRFPVARDRRPEALPPAPPNDPGRAPERTPIFEQMESTWFDSRRRTGPGPEAGDSTGSDGVGEGPRPPAPPAERPTAPPPPAAAPPSGANGSPESAPAPAGAGASAGASRPGWTPSPNDERWRRAEQLRQPAAGGITTSGLPRRVPRANLMAGTAQQRETTTTGPQVSRAPADVRGRLTNLRRGIQQGRQAGTGATNTDRGFGSNYGQER
ncbi:nitrate- and nitrite sensing domain-containing protein [Streptomyces sp. ST2-7A]|uniref:sensor histidine kinase n=1 Tax=Streptomyces sp. ST2-7A TaxID=2907214 RepID=UPI001F190783|nr:nitrate- and nitrite sensing domain-containing protein [Streptomyces sp. ST2-7A]MCE7079900.1 nitrate- and nitrite sensing domain-containing protein [Streptomyces sp. ST2-7A]